MRTLTALSVLTLAALPLAAQQPKTHADSMHAPMHADSMHARMHADSGHAMAMDHDMMVAGGGTLPAGWAGRTDGASGATTNVKFMTMGPGLHLTLGPATILYRADDAVSGPFHTLATFTQTKAPTHPEGYGLFFSGHDLAGAGQHYIYFLVRGDGKFLIKRRDGANTSVIQDWTENPAVVKADADGKATNMLEIDAKSDAGKVDFRANGKELYSMAAEPADIAGNVGIRANHNLDLHISGFAVHK